MKNTIELLEAIGSDASLRHASAGDLTQHLAQAQASAALLAAAGARDSSLLSMELGQQKNQVPQVIQTPGHEEEAPQEEELDEPVEKSLKPSVH